jgi:DNA-binding MarR family transcriptional regulator
MYALWRVHLIWRRWLQGVLVGQGITLPQLEVLRLLEVRKCLNPSQIAPELGCDRSTVTCILRNLVAAEWITVEPNRDNAKFRDVRLTPRGSAKLDAVAAHIALPERGRFDPVSCLATSERRTLLAILEKLNEHLASAPWRGVVAPE